MEMMRVYRVEDKHGNGPYRNKYKMDSPLQVRMNARHCDWNTHPSELLDFDKGHTPGERFAFDSMQKLVTWFGPYLPGLIREGYKVRVYSVPKILVRSGKSGKQVMFQSKRAILVDTRK